MNKAAKLAEAFHKGQSQRVPAVVMLDGLWLKVLIPTDEAYKEPAPVATLERNFDRTSVYLRVRERARQRGQDWKVECLRTTSPLERVQRHFRQKARQVVISHSWDRIETAIRLVISHRHLTRRRSDC